MYSVKENSGTVTICAEVRSPFPVRPDCQLDISFSFDLVASPATADGVSYFTLCITLLYYSQSIMVIIFHSRWLRLLTECNRVDLPSL